MSTHNEAYHNDPEYRALFNAHGEFINEHDAAAYAGKRGFTLNELILRKGLKARTVHSFYTLSLYNTTRK